MKKTVFILAITIAAAVGVSAQSHQKYIGMAKAKKIASEQVTGRITSAEREKEHGKMIYSFDIRGTDKKIHEVTIDAYTGEVLTNEIETPKDEAKEKAEGAKSKKH